MEIVFIPFGEIDDDKYEEIVLNKINEYKNRLDNYSDKKIHYEVQETNHGRSADLVTITVTLLTIAGTAFFTIPAAHKKVRESIEEWKKIKKELDSLLSALSGQDSASLPIEILFLKAVEDLEDSKISNNLEFLHSCQIPTQNLYGFDDMKTYMFVFRDHCSLNIISYDSYGTLLWKRDIQL